MVSDLKGLLLVTQRHCPGVCVSFMIPKAYDSGWHTTGLNRCLLTNLVPHDSLLAMPRLPLPSFLFPGDA